MYNQKTFLRNRLIIFSNIIFLIGVLLWGSAPAVAQNINSGQWKSAGGIKILSGNHNFTTSWSSDSYSREKGLFWQGGFYVSPDKRKYAPYEKTVKNSVAPVKGQITVRGPGHIGLYQQTKGGASIVMYDANTKEEFRPWYISGSNINPDGEFWGKIPADKEITIVVEAHMSSYDNMMNTGEYAFHAPQEITDFEVWFFPQKGGKVIDVKSTTAKFDKPKPGILYYIDKDCK